MMNKYFIRIMCLSIMLAFSINAYSGKLLIVGGALSNKNKSIYTGFINALPNENSKIVIIPVASSKPSATGKKFYQDLIDYGVDKNRIVVFPLAVVDDNTTEVDESKWFDNADDEVLMRSISDAEGFWFVGGDQMRIIKTLKKGDNKTSLLLELIRKKLTADAVVGGTSAGAAMMSDPMIAGGDSFTSMMHEPVTSYYGTESQDNGFLFLNEGLGLFKFGVVDQHFDRKGRLGRLIKTLSLTKHKYGFAVDEDTAMMVDMKIKTLSVLGSGGVTIINSEKAAFNKHPFSASGLQVSVIPEGCGYNISKNEFIISGSMLKTINNEYSSGRPHQGAGLSMGNPRLDQFLGHYLLDNSQANEIRRYHFDETGSGFIFNYKQTEKSIGYWREHNGSQEKFAAINVFLDIHPIELKIKRLGE